MKRFDRILFDGVWGVARSRLPMAVTANAARIATRLLNMRWPPSIFDSHVTNAVADRVAP